jgi:YidC/Oxa1 family membrane protein insertase
LEEIGYDKGMGLSEFQSIGLANPYGFTGFFQYWLEQYHLYSGMPWWIDIVTFGVFIRLSALPLSLFELKKREEAKPFMQEYSQMEAHAMNLRKQQKHDEATAATAALKQLRKSRGHYSSTQIALLNIFPSTIGLLAFLAMRPLNTSLLESMTVGGAFWFPDLTQPDLTLILPISYCAVSFVDVVIRRKFGASQASGNAFTDFLQKLAIYLPFGLFPLLMDMATSTFLLLIGTRTTLMFQSILSNSNAFRRLLRIPEIKPNYALNAEKYYGGFAKTQKAAISGPEAASLGKPSVIKVKSYKPVAEANKVSN